MEMEYNEGKALKSVVYRISVMSLFLKFNLIVKKPFVVGVWLIVHAE